MLSGLVGAGAGLLAVIAPALSQDSTAPTLSRPSGGVSAPLGGSGSGVGTSARSGLTLRGTSGTSSALPPVQADLLPGDTTMGRSRSFGEGATVRPGLQPPKRRRIRPPAVEPVAGPFRATIQPPGIAAEVQPLQSGLPDPVVPPPLPRKKPPVEDPYAPLGLRLGGLTLYPSIGESIGYDTNPNRTQTQRKGSFVSQTDGELRLQSDWSRHELTGSLRGAYNEYPSNPAASRPEGAGRLGFRYDVSRDTQVDVEGHYLVDTQRPSSPDLNASVRERPIFATEGASLGVTQRFNRLLVTLRGTVDRTDYQNARLTSGSILDQSDRNVTQYGTKLRVGYELKPGLVPFVEVVADTRDYDKRVDSAGYARSSDGVGAKIGTSFELTPLVTGEISAGAIRRSYEDKRLGNLTSPIADLTLAYALTPLTTIRATGQASVDETTIVGANGIRTLKGTVEVAHDLRRNLTVTAGLSAADYAYQGVPVNEHSFGATLKADWRLNRNVTLRGSYAYERMISSVSGSSYNANVFLLGLRLQP